MSVTFYPAEWKPLHFAPHSTCWLKSRLYLSLSLPLQPVKLSSYWSGQLSELILLVEGRVWWVVSSPLSSLTHSPPSSSSSSHTINTLKFNTNLLLLQIPNSTSEGYVCTKHFLQFWEVTTSSRQIKFTISTFNICVRSHSLMLTFTLLEKYASTHLVGDKNVQCLLQWEKSHAETWISGTVEQRNTTDHLIILDRFTQIIYQSVFVKVL